MEERVSLSGDARAALEEGAALCREANLAIFTPEHMLAGALIELGRSALAGLPGRAEIAAALEMTHGTAEDAPPDEVSFGPGARAVLNAVALAALRAGRDSVGARELAAGVILTGEVTPAFYTALGLGRDSLLTLLAGPGGSN